MSNLKKVLALTLVLMLTLSVAAGAVNPQISQFRNSVYSDGASIEQINGNYRLSADLLHDIGVVIGKVTPNTGGSNTTYMYDPKGAFDRATLARILFLLSTRLTENSSNTGAAYSKIVVPFKDIKNSWAANYIKYCYSKGLLSGRSSTKFDPTALVTAQELATTMLALRGFTKADLAKNYPSNVIFYGYTDKCNLFDTGLSGTVPSNAETTGVYLPGTTNAAGIKNYNSYGKFDLNQALNREQAFYMIFNNLVYGTLVTKLSGTAAHGSTNTNIVFDSYLGSSDNYLYSKYGVRYVEETVSGIITGTSKYAMGSDKSSTADKFIISDNLGRTREYVDYGYTATVKQSGLSVPTGYTLSATDWNANIGRTIITKVASWSNKDYSINTELKAWGYTFVWDTGNNDRGINGCDVIITKEKAVKCADKNAIEINGTKYDTYFTDPVSGYGKLFVSINNKAVTTPTAVYYKDPSTGNVSYPAIAALKLGSGKSADTLAFKLVNNKVYGVFAVNTVWQQVTSVGSGEYNKDNNPFSAGMIRTTADPATARVTNIEGLAKGDWILAYVDESDIGINQLGIIKGTKAAKSSPKYITEATPAGAGTTKYYTNGTSTELVFGDSDGAPVIPTIDPAKQYYIYSVGAYAFRLEEATNASRDVLLTGVTKYTLTNGKFIYVFTGYPDGDPANTVSYTTASLDTAQYDGLTNGTMATIYTTPAGAFADAVVSTAYIGATTKASAYANVDTAGEFFYDSALKIIYIYDAGVPATHRRIVNIGTDTKTYILKSNCAVSEKGIADAAKIFVKVKDTNTTTSAVYIIGLTTET